MKHAMVLLLSIFLTLLSCDGKAEESFVYCGKSDGSSWYSIGAEFQTASLAFRPIPEPRRTRGKWHKYTYHGIDIPVFLITESTYQNLKNLCGQDYNPHPTQSMLDTNWYIFATHDNNGVLMIMPGYISINIPPSIDLANRM